MPPEGDSESRGEGAETWLGAQNRGPVVTGCHWCDHVAASSSHSLSCSTSGHPGLPWLLHPSYITVRVCNTSRFINGFSGLEQGGAEPHLDAQVRPGCKNSLCATIDTFTASRNPSKKTPMPLVAPQMPNIVAVIIISATCFVVDLSLLSERRVQAAWSCLHSPVRWAGFPGVSGVWSYAP